MASTMDTIQFIAAKRDGQEHLPGDLQRFIAAAMAGDAADYQVSAWLMAVYPARHDGRETIDLTVAMRDSGRSYRPGRLRPPSVDKHSTGGVGDKTTAGGRAVWSRRRRGGGQDVRAWAGLLRRHARQARIHPRLPGRTLTIDEFGTSVRHRGPASSPASRPTSRRPMASSTPCAT